ncbi:MAG: iron-containing alcohol dehydrogenase [Butyricicoccus sp.]|nr:iron-containing alcohol dehydrogenase [Butyricicoccus sp.]
MQKFHMSTEIIFGEGALACLEELSGQNVFVVTDRFLLTSGMVDSVTAHLKNCRITVFPDVVPDPPMETVAAGAAMLQQCGAQAIVAVGGGSSIDTAKVIRTAALELAPEKEISFYAVPTTSGSGSEVTGVAIITDQKKGVKCALIDDVLRPHIAVLDPALVRSVPAGATAVIGVDVLTHALEAYVARGANDFTDAWSEKATSMVFDYLERAYENGDDLEAREKMHNASCMAGLAFDKAGLGAAHGLAHALGGSFHLTHGLLNAILLPAVMRANIGAGDSGRTEETNAAARKYARLAAKLGLTTTNSMAGASALIRAVEQLNRRLGIPAKLSQAGISKKDLAAATDQIIEHALADGTMQTNPRTLTAKDMAWILKQIR